MPTVEELVIATLDPKKLKELQKILKKGFAPSQHQRDTLERRLRRKHPEKKNGDD